MSVGKLRGAFAYEVAPRQQQPFVGGRVAATTELQAALDAAFVMSGVASAPAVTLEVDQTAGGSRAHSVRDALMSICFGDSAAAEAAALVLAERLASATDARSKPSLLMITVHDTATTGRLRSMLWTFPQQDVFRLGVSGGKPKLDMLAAFNRESRLRKAAMFEGGNVRSDMLTARVLDFQASATERSVADLWIVKFLAARSQMSSAEGTRTLARALRHAHDRLADNPEKQEQIHSVIAALRTVPRTRWSMNDIAREFFDPDVVSEFSAAIRVEERSAVFDIDRGIFDTMVSYHVYELSSGVRVSAPFQEVGDSVRIEEVDGVRSLTATGAIAAEKVRSRAQ